MTQPNQNIAFAYLAPNVSGSLVASSIPLLKNGLNITNAMYVLRSLSVVDKVFGPKIILVLKVNITNLKITA
ncbi:hypothetical protein B9T25_02595 [Acinetobacter sp. ANC 4470]|nr:hypothetical protein B9T25_02595 [Acinetobacter sp. ANC 4470]